MSLSVELDPNWTEWTNKFGKLDILVNLKNIGKLFKKLGGNATEQCILCHTKINC